MPDRLPPPGEIHIASGASGQPTARPSASVTAAGPDAPKAVEPRQQEVARLKSLLTDPNMRVSTHHDRESGRVVLRVQRAETGELVEQIPSGKLLRLYAMMRESLIDEQV